MPDADPQLIEAVRAPIIDSIRNAQAPMGQDPSMGMGGPPMGPDTGAGAPPMQVAQAPTRLPRKTIDPREAAAAIERQLAGVNPSQGP